MVMKLLSWYIFDPLLSLWGEGLRCALRWHPEAFASDVRKDGTEQSWGMLAHGHFRWMEHIPNVPSANFNFFLWEVPSGSLHSPASRLSVNKTGIQSRPCCPFLFVLRVLCTLKKQKRSGNSCLFYYAKIHSTMSGMVSFVCLFSPCMTNLTCLTILSIRSPAARSMWEAMLTSKHKEAVMEVRRHLVEAASKEKLPIKMSMGKNINITDGEHILFPIKHKTNS